MARKSRSSERDRIINYHVENVKYGSREWKLIFALASEEEFNRLEEKDCIIVTDDTELLCGRI